MSLVSRRSRLRVLLTIVLTLAVATPGMAAAAGWPQFRFNGSHSGTNPTEKMISPGNVSSLVTAWTGAIGSGSTSSSPAVVNGTAYIGSDDGTLYAFDASGTTGCSGVPKTCSPLWIGTTADTAVESP